MDDFDPGPFAVEAPAAGAPPPRPPTLLVDLGDFLGALGRGAEAELARIGAAVAEGEAPDLLTAYQTLIGPVEQRASEQAGSPPDAGLRNARDVGENADGYRQEVLRYLPPPNGDVALDFQRLPEAPPFPRTLITYAPEPGTDQAD